MYVLDMLYMVSRGLDLTKLALCNYDTTITNAIHVIHLLNYIERNKKNPILLEHH